MDDLRRRFATLDRVPTPDLWDAIERRAAAAGSTTRVTAVVRPAGTLAGGSGRRQLVLLLAVAALLAALVAGALVAGSSRPDRLAVVVRPTATVAPPESAAPSAAPSAPSASPAPSRSTTPSPSPTEVAPGITAWATYTSAIYGTTLSYPSDWVAAPATQTWAGEGFPREESSYADTFVSPGEVDTQIGVNVWQMHIDVFTGTADLNALARKFCFEGGASSCETFTQRAVPLDFNNGGGGGCAILVPTPGQQYAFLSDVKGCLITEGTSWITVVVVDRADDFPSADRYGGSVELLRSIVTTTKVWRPGQP